MIQELFSIGNFSVSPFGVMLVIALLSAYAQLAFEMKRRKIGNEDDASAVVVACGLGGILGGKIYYAALYRDWGLLFDRSGIVWYGCFIAGFFIFVWMTRRRRLPLAPMLDASAASVALAYGVGRIGCFLVGDDYGRPTDLPWGIAFKNGIPRTTAYNLKEHFGIEPAPGTAMDDFVAVHPTQIYETLLALAIWVVLIRYARREPRPGNVFILGITLLSLERFAIEFLRAKDDRFFGTLTLAQVIAAAIVAVLLVVAWRRRGQAGEPAPAAEAGT